MLTASPQQSNAGFLMPITPATTGPTCRPILTATGRPVSTARAAVMSRIAKAKSAMASACSRASSPVERPPTAI